MNTPTPRHPNLPDGHELADWLDTVMYAVALLRSGSLVLDGREERPAVRRGPRGARGRARGPGSSGAQRRRPSTGRQRHGRRMNRAAGRSADTLLPAWLTP